MAALALDVLCSRGDVRLQKIIAGVSPLSLALHLVCSAGRKMHPERGVRKSNA